MSDNNEVSDKRLIGLYQDLHRKIKTYGAGSAKYLKEISLIVDYLKPKTILDYGCGKGVLVEVLSYKYPEIDIYGYDPAISGRETLPVTSADLIVNTDVLEHIPADIIPGVLKEMAGISRNAFFALHHGLAYTVLADGQNAHCTVRPPAWYQLEIAKAFGDAMTVLPGRGAELSVIATFPMHAHIIRQYHDICADRLRLDELKRRGRSAINEVRSALRKPFRE